jgi:hypothetical protein
MARRGTAAKIDIQELEKLSALQATDVEIAAWFDVSPRTIERRRKKPKFAEVMERGKAKGRLSLRRLQLRLAERGSTAMAIFLGKQILGQADRLEHQVDDPHRVLKAIILPKIWEVPPEVLNPPPRPPLPPMEIDADRRRRQVEADYLAIRKADRLAIEEKYGSPGNDGRY